jgi:hypothetical protein
VCALSRRKGADIAKVSAKKNQSGRSVLIEVDFLQSCFRAFLPVAAQLLHELTN